MYLPGRGGQFVHAADVSNIDIEERSKKVAVYELKVERIPFPVALHTCWSSSETTCCPSTFYHRDFHAPWREDVIESLIERTTWIVVDSSRSVAWTIRFTFHYFNLFESDNALSNLVGSLQFWYISSSINSIENTGETLLAGYCNRRKL